MNRRPVAICVSKRTYTILNLFPACILEELLHDRAKEQLEERIEVDLSHCFVSLETDQIARVVEQVSQELQP